jgi:hypothetical protein
MVKESAAVDSSKLQSLDIHGEKRGKETASGWK